MQKFPFDKVKVSQYFIRGLPDSTESSAIVRLIVGLGRSLGITVVAEGVETPQQAECLRAEGCSAAQGFLFGRAARLRELHKIVERQSWQPLRRQSASPRRGRLNTTSKHDGAFSPVDTCCKTCCLWQKL